MSAKDNAALDKRIREEREHGERELDRMTAIEAALTTIRKACFKGLRMDLGRDGAVATDPLSYLLSQMLIQTHQAEDVITPWREMLQRERRSDRKLQNVKSKGA